MILIMKAKIFDLRKLSGGPRRMLRPGEYLFHLGEPIGALHIVLDGEVHLVRFETNGGSVILQRSGSGGVVAEASLFAQRYHCDAIARSATAVQSIPRRPLRDRLRRDPNFAEALMTHLAHEVQITRFRTEVLSLKTVAASLDAWEAWYGGLPPKGEWRDLAHQIGVSPAALYRELAKRRPNG